VITYDFKALGDVDVKEILLPERSIWVNGEHRFPNPNIKLLFRRRKM